MSDTPPNVKVYDRPEKKMPSPMILILIVLALLVGGYFIYRAMNPPSDAAPQTRTTSQVSHNHLRLAGLMTKERLSHVA